MNIHIFPKAISSRSKMKRYRQYKTKSGWSGKYMRIKSISTLAQNWHQKSNKPREARCTMRSTEKKNFFLVIEIFIMFLHIFEFAKEIRTYIL